jgi:hypothetical protein
MTWTVHDVDSFEVEADLWTLVVQPLRSVY